MPNIGVVLKDEIRRLARKEVRTSVLPVQKRLAEARRHVTELRRKVGSLESTVKRLKTEADQRMLEAARAGAKETGAARIGSRSIRSQRKRLKLTRDEFGTLLGVSANTVYLWETDKVTPRGRSRAALVGVRRIGAREAKELIRAATSPNDTKAKAKARGKGAKRRK